MQNDPSDNYSGNHNAIKYTSYLRLVLIIFIGRNQVFYLFLCEMGYLKSLGHQGFQCLYETIESESELERTHKDQFPTHGPAQDIPSHIMCQRALSNA